VNRLAPVITVAALMTLTPLAAHADEVDPYAPIMCADYEVLVGDQCINPEPEPTDEPQPEPTTVPTTVPTVEPTTPPEEPTVDTWSEFDCTGPNITTHTTTTTGDTSSETVETYPMTPDEQFNICGICPDGTERINNTCITPDTTTTNDTTPADNPNRDDVLALTGSTTNWGGWALLLATAIGAGISYTIGAFINHRKATR
jgi:hypothetical protein